MKITLTEGERKVLPLVDPPARLKDPFMFRRTVLLPWLLMTAVIRAQSSPAQTSASAAQSSVVIGTVVDHRGAGVARALVRASGAAGQGRFEAHALTDEHGEFFFVNVPPGQLWLDASKDGYAEGRYKQTRPGGAPGTLILPPGARQTDIVLTIWKLAVVSGRVTDGAGLPLAGESVSVFRPSIVAGHPRLDAVAMQGGQIDDRGEYRSSISSQASTPSDSGVVLVRSDSRRPALERRLPLSRRDYSATPSATTSEIITLAPGEHRSGVDFRIAPVLQRARGWHC